MIEAEDKRKSLEFAQNIIARQANNAFLLKGWSVTLVTALLAVAATVADGHVGLLALIPAIVFWALDGYYLDLERAFRCRYDEIRKMDMKSGAADEVFRLTPTNRRGAARQWARCTFCRPSVVLFHGAVVATIVVTSCYLAS